MKPAPSLIPRFNMDYGFSDFRCSIHSIFTKKNCNITSLQSIFGDKSFFFTNNGRSALYILLKAMNLPIGSEVGVPVYSCPIVWESIKKARLVPRFIDIDTSTYTMDPNDLKRKISGLKSIIVIHTFGHPADMDEIKKIAGDIPIIEDCAHSPFSRYKGQITGILGSASIFTFSLGKYLSAGGGGMILVNQDNLKESVQNEIDLLDTPSLIDEVLNSFRSFVHSFLYHKPWFGLFVLPVGCILNRYFDITEQHNFKVTRIRKGNFGVLIKKLKDFEEKTERQREISNFMVDSLKDSSLTLLREAEWAYCVYYMFPIRFLTKNKRELACSLLRKSGIDTTRYWDNYSVAQSNYGYKGDCPNTETILQTLATIPNYYTLSNKELSKIVKIIQKTMESV